VYPLLAAQPAVFCEQYSVRFYNPVVDGTQGGIGASVLYEPVLAIRCETTTNTTRTTLHYTCTYRTTSAESPKPDTTVRQRVLRFHAATAHYTYYTVP